MKRHYICLNFIFVLSLFLTVMSCKSKDEKPPYQLDNNNTAAISIPYEEMGGVKMIPVKLNGITMNMIYDTGCSGIHLSLNEVQTLAKNGKLTENDILVGDYSRIADGSIVQMGKINIKEIVIGNGDNVLVLHDRPASVTLNQVAPILLGNEVLDELASVEVDNVEKTIKFYKK